MIPKITIDKLALRFEWDEGGVNLFFDDLFRWGNKGDWHREAMDAIKKSYEICIKENIEPPKEED